MNREYDGKLLEMVAFSNGWICFMEPIQWEHRHFHPAGSITPSGCDVQIMERMEKVCKLVGIPLMDSIIVGFGREDYFSFREAAMLEQERNQADRVAEEKGGRGGR